MRTAWSLPLCPGTVSYTHLGTLHLNDPLEILGVKEDVQSTVVTGIEMFRKQLDEAMAGDNILSLIHI